VRSPTRDAVSPTTAAGIDAKAVAGISSPSTVVVDGGLPHATELQQRAPPVLDQPETAIPNIPPTPVDPTGSRRPSVPAITTKPLRDPVSLQTPVESSEAVRADEKDSVVVPKTLPSAHDRDGGLAKISPRLSKSAGTGVTSLEIPSDPLRRKHDARPSLTLGLSQGEQPPSPASSVDPYNNNTPVPVAASPDTSPAEEVTEDVATIDRQNHKHDRSGRPRSSLVPSTPDEQLRFEEAQSRIAQPSNGVIHDLPTSKEVIQESVDAEADADRMVIDQEPTAVSPEAKLRQAADAMVSDSLSPSARVEAIETSTTRKSASSPPTQPGLSQPERMTTRVSSGAIRHKSVSEILGETPKSVAHDRSLPATPSDQASPDSVARMRFKDRKEREKERSRLSTVVFPKQPASQQEKADSMELTPRDMDAVAKLNEEQDYLFTLFLNRAYAPPRGTNLNTLLASAHKTLSTGSHLLEYKEQMDCRTLRRIYALQNANRWPLRQLKRSVEPPRQGAHWDVVLDHMKWMRTDFREERKWKIAAAKSCADWCAEYVNSDEEHRTLLRVQVKIPTSNLAEKDAPKPALSPPSEDNGDEVFGVSHPTPDLVPSAEEESVSEFNDEPRHDIHDTVAPAAIFSLGSDEFNFSIDMNPAAEKLLDELPIYSPLQIAPGTSLPAFKAPPDSAWKTELLPVSKFASAKISFRDDEPPRKRSRYDYSQYCNDSDTHITELAPEQTNVALFRPENKPIRDRIHPGHQFRPPTEHPMPSVGFFESRSSSQWTYAEDDELRRLVKEYSYNWSLISSCLTPSSLFTSGAERRTPWECFERWVGLEGLPADMSKTQYFRAYHQRLETAQRTVLAQQQAAQQQQQQQQQQGANAQPQPPVRRRTTQPLRVDRRRSSKHLALLDAMRKLAKKRETMLQKQQHGMLGI
jgi:chromatin modification-related protein VID21